MQFGVLQFFSWTRRVPLNTVYERALARIEIMDRTGYDCMWLAEHHFNTYSVLKFNRSLQHRTGKGCDDDTETAVGAGRTRQTTLARPPLGAAA